MDISVLVEEGIELAPAITVDWLQGIVAGTLIAEEVPFSAEMSLVITNQERIQELNRTYRNKDKPTDVLSFAMIGPEPIIGVTPTFISPPDKILHLGEVLVSYPQAEKQAEEHNHSVLKEMAVLIIHGTLHLLGYDHEKSAEMASKMETREKDIFNLLGANTL